ncbi:tyrosine-type recombinase/integrase [Microbispora sp. NPDC049633]|uniref:tyrosine-type recombinase/integrase n=1 Tax=Microbispora sp. NPDC049633 TaxID=3154355 RepID=UPI00343CE001
MLRWSSADPRQANDRALVGLAAGTGLRWGERVRLRWDAVDLDAGTVRVERVLGTVTRKPYPKSKAGRREVPFRLSWPSCSPRTASATRPDRSEKCSSTRRAALSAARS